MGEALATFSLQFHLEHLTVFLWEHGKKGCMTTKTSQPIILIKMATRVIGILKQRYILHSLLFILVFTDSPQSQKNHLPEDWRYLIHVSDSAVTQAPLPLFPNPRHDWLVTNSTTRYRLSLTYLYQSLILPLLISDHSYFPVADINHLYFRCLLGTLFI